MINTSGMGSGGSMIFLVLLLIILFFFFLAGVSITMDRRIGSVG